MSDIQKKKRPVFTPLASGLGPLIAFIATYVFAPVAEPQKIFVATAVLVAATIAATIEWRVRRRVRPPFSWVSSLLLIAMGGLALWLQEDTFIKMQPTLQAGLFSTLLVSTLLTGTPRLESLIGEVRVTMEAEGRRRLIGYLACAGVLMALLNEAVWRNSSTGFWVGFQLWGRFPVIILVAVVAVPLLKHHGVACKRPDTEDSRPAE